jgi:hypothetical protein
MLSDSWFICKEGFVQLLHLHHMLEPIEPVMLHFLCILAFSVQKSITSHWLSPDQQVHRVDMGYFMNGIAKGPHASCSHGGSTGQGAWLH